MTKVFKEIYRYNRSKISIFILLSIISKVLGVLSPFLSSKVIDSLVAGEGMYKVLHFVGISVILSVIGIIISYIYELQMAIFKIEFIYKKKIEYLELIRKIPIEIYRNFAPSYLNQRVELDVVTTVNFVLDTYIMIIINIFQAIGYIYILFKINLTIGLISIGFIPLYTYVYKKFRDPIKEGNLKVKESKNILFASFDEQYEFICDIKLASNSQEHNKFLLSKFEIFRHNFVDYIKSINTFNSLDQILSALFQFIVFIVGGYKVINNTLSIGKLTIITTYFHSTLQIIKYYFDVGQRYQDFKSSEDRLLEFHFINLSSNGTKRIEEIYQVSGEISYIIRNEKLLEGKKIEVNRNELLTIYGANGSGKTTLAMIMMGVLDLQDKDNFVKINNVDIKNIDMEYQRKNHILFIPQVCRMTDKTVGETFKEIDENITLENITLYYEFLDNNIWDEVLSIVLPYWDKKTTTLSGGERQILFILRGLIKKPQVIIADEPTASLDKQNQIFFYKLIKYLKKSCIIIIITHDENFKYISDKELYI